MIISNDTHTTAGETAILVCVTQQQTSGQITWTHNGQPVTNSTLVSITEEDVLVGGRTFTQSFLQICSVANTDAGDYVCVVTNGQTSVNSSTQLTVTGKITVGD